MADYNYTGVTAYIKDTLSNGEAFRVLADALYQFEPLVNMELDIPAHRQSLVQSPAFKELEDNFGFFSKDECWFPINTPKDYLNVQIQKVEIKGNRLVRLYFPIVQRSGDATDELIQNALCPVLVALFGNDLITVKTRSALEFEDFTAAQEKILVHSKFSATVVTA
jgi:hypothetical protein